jgi:hypothetical protein
MLDTNTKLRLEVDLQDEEVQLIKHIKAYYNIESNSIIRAGTDIYLILLPFLGANGYLKFVQNGLVHESDDGVVLDDSFPRNILPSNEVSHPITIASKHRYYQDLNRMVEKSKAASISQVIRAGLYLYALMLKAEEQGYKLGVFKDGELQQLIQSSSKNKDIDVQKDPAKLVAPTP